MKLNKYKINQKTLCSIFISKIKINPQYKFIYIRIKTKIKNNLYSIKIFKMCLTNKIIIFKQTIINLKQINSYK